MKKILSTILLIAIAAVNMAAQNMADQIVPMDEAVRKGTLANGLTYYIRHNEWPEKRAFFYIAQKVGSIQEDDDQRGLAHFLEHMCFNGTKNFPGDKLKTYLEGIGVRFGENLNAYTSFDETVYNIDNVNVEIAGAVDTCLLILHDWAGNLLLEGKEIDKERGVINEEWRMRSNAIMRMYEKALPTIYPDSKYGHRMPIGTMDVVMNFPHETLRNYYHKWYRPDLQGIVIVGDINVDEIEQKIKTIFADIQPAGPDAGKFEYYPVSDNEEPIVSINKDKEQNNNSFYFMWKTEAFPREMKNTAAYLMTTLITYSIEKMFDERFAEILQKENPPFLRANFGYEDFFVSKTKEAFSASVTCEENKYEEGIKAIYREVLRAKRHGFTEAEFGRFKSEYKSMIENLYLHRDKIESSQYVNDCVRHFIDNEPMQSIEWTYTNVTQLLDMPQFNVAMANGFMNQMPEKNLVVIAFAGDKEGNILPTKEDILKWMAEVEAEDIEAPKHEEDNRPLISQMPEPGTVKKMTEDKFGATLITLSNGVRIHVKKTDFAPNTIMMQAYSNGGTSLYDIKELDQTSSVSLAAVGGWGEFSNTEINKKLAGIQAEVATGVNDSGEMVSGSCAKKDFETMMQLTYLHFTAPRKDTEIYNSTIQRTKVALKNKEIDPMTALQDTINKVVYNDNPRAKRTKAEDLDRINYDRILEIYNERFADADDFDFFLIGDLDIDTIAPLLAKYLGALPTVKGKEKTKPTDLKIAKGEHTNIFEKELETPSANVLFIYHAPMKSNLKNSFMVTMLDQLMDLKYTESVREDEGGAYGVPTSASLKSYPEKIVQMTIQLPTSPDKRERMTEIIYKGIDEMVNQGPKESDLQKIKEYLARKHEESLKDNGYWLRQMINYSKTGHDNVTDYNKVLNSITVADLQKLAKKIFRSGNRIEVGMTSPKAE